MTNDALCTKAILAHAKSAVLVHSFATGKSYPLPLVRWAGSVVQKVWLHTKHWEDITDLSL